MDFAALNIVDLSSQRISQLCNQWRELTAASAADPLFLGWAWQKLWWDIYSDKLSDAALRSFLVQEGSEKIAAVVNVYTQRVRRLPLTNFQSLQLVGASWRTDSAMLSEYLEPIVRAQNADVTKRILAHISDLDWDEFVVELTPQDGPFATAVRGWCSRTNWYLRELDPAVSYQADLSAGFASFVAKLSASARRRLINNRGRLQQRGKIEVRKYCAERAGDALEVLNELHSRRWQQPAFDAGRMVFHRALHAALPVEAQPIVSVIEVDGLPVSALYDIRFPTRQYNIQMGFDPHFDSSLSLGLLHLGYAIEDASTCGVPIYDFLAGPGLATNYKERISTGNRPLITLQVVRNFPGGLIYRISDLVRCRNRSGH